MSLLPDINASEMVNGQVVPLTPAEQLTAHARATATATITVGGTITNLDKLRARLKSGAFEVDVTAALTGSDTTTTAAAKLAAAINGDATLRSLGYAASSLAAVCTLTGSGPIPMIVALDGWAESATLTITCGGTVTAGDKEIIKIVSDLLPTGTKYIKVAASGTTTQRATAIKNAINADVDLAAAAIVATSSGAEVDVDLGAVDSDVAITAYSWKASRTVTVGGTPAADDAPVFTVTNATLPGGDTALTYTVLDGDDTDAVAAALADLINDEEGELFAAGFSAVAASSVVTVTLPDEIGAITLAKTDDNTTYTLSAAVTETQTIGGTATETVTISQEFTGGSGPILPLADFQYMYNGHPLSFRLGFPEIVPDDVLTLLLRDVPELIS